MASHLFVLIFAIFAVSAVSAQWWPHCPDGRRTIVHLFEWRWQDIADECERFLAPKGFCGVQVSPPNEYLVIMTEWNQRPWWERYQPVSYKTYSRSGDETAFRDMVARCNNVGVRIYVDALLNHMCGNAAGKGIGIGGSEYDAEAMSFPAVPYTSVDFNTKTSSPATCTSNSGDVENWNDPIQVRNCKLVGLLDLNQGRTWVQDRLVEWLNTLISYGVAGFRLDAAKHMWPADMKLILDRLDNLPTRWFLENSRPFVYQEVIDYNTNNDPIKASEYYGFGRVTEFNCGRYLSDAFRGYTQLKWLKTFGEGWAMIPDGNSLCFVDNHDTQRSGNVLTFFDSRRYKMAVTFMLSWPYGFARIMSSYYWDRNFVNGHDANDWYGPPADSNYNIKEVTINADGTCGNGWICEHRWRQITNMAGFRKVAGDTAVENWWDDGNNQISFSRGNRAFYAVNGDSSKNMDVWLSTGLSGGWYCDVISGDRSADKKSCTSTAIKVEDDGRTNIVIKANAEDPIVAIHIDSKLE